MALGVGGASGDALEQAGGGGIGHAADGCGEGGERRAEEGAEKLVAVAGDHDVLRDADALLAKGGHDAHGPQIIVTGEAIGQGLEMLEDLLADAVAEAKNIRTDDLTRGDVLEGLVPLDALTTEGAAIAGDGLRHTVALAIEGGAGAESGGDGHAAGPLLEKVSGGAFEDALAIGDKGLEARQGDLADGDDGNLADGQLLKSGEIEGIREAAEDEAFRALVEEAIDGGAAAVFQGLKIADVGLVAAIEQIARELGKTGLGMAEDGAEVDDANNTAGAVP